MTPSADTLAQHARRIRATLDEQIRLLELRRSQLEALSVAIVDRDDGGMEAILAGMQQAMNAQADADLWLKAARRALAQDLGLPIGRVRLEFLTRELRGPERAEIEQRRRRVVDLAESVRHQHVQTSILLTECARVNRLLLEALLPQSKPVDTYGSGGPQRWRPDTGTVSAER